MLWYNVIGCLANVLPMKNCEVRIELSMGKKLSNGLPIIFQTCMVRDSLRAIYISLFNFINSSLRFSTQWVEIHQYFRGLIIEHCLG